MKKTMIAIATAALAVLSTNAAAANISIPPPSQTITYSVDVKTPVQTSIETAELRGKRYSSLRHKRIAKLKHKGFHSRKLHGHNKGFRVQKKTHLKHHDHFAHDRKFHHRNLKAKHFKRKSVKRFKY